MGTDNKYTGSDEVVTLEGRFVQLYFDAIQDLPKCWMDGDRLNKAKYNQQIQFIIALIPFEDEQDKIFHAWHARTKELKATIPGMTEEELVFAANLVPVTKTMSFICANFELINTDITGPATSKQYRDSAVQMPENMNNPRVEI